MAKQVSGSKNIFKLIEHSYLLCVCVCVCVYVCVCVRAHVCASSQLFKVFLPCALLPCDLLATLVGASGDITWTAFPFNGQAEFYDPALFR